MSDVKELIAEVNPEALMADGLDEAVIGIGSQHASPLVVIYDYDVCVRLFMQQNEWARDEAIEWMEHNVVCSYLGEHTPIFMKKISFAKFANFDGAGTYLTFPTPEEALEEDWEVTPYGEKK